jgi:hypothetical protein
MASPAIWRTFLYSLVSCVTDVKAPSVRAEISMALPWSFSSEGLAMNCSATLFSLPLSLE